MMKKVQRFGGAMLAPVMLFSFSGVIVGLAILFQNEQIMGQIAHEGTFWWKFWNLIAAGGWTVFFQLPLLFVVGLPIGLAKKHSGRAAMEALVAYLTFNYFINALLTYWPTTFMADIMQDVGGSSGLAMISGIKSLDTGMVGALLVSGITVYLHNKYFEQPLPEVLSIFSGSVFVTMLAFFAMIPVAVLMAFVWPVIQEGVRSLQGFFINSGNLGVWVYSFLEKILIPTGMHHFIYSPFAYDNAVVQGGMAAYWASHIGEFQTSAQSLKEMYPMGGFALSGMSKIFGSIGLSAAIIKAAKPEKRKTVIALMVPAALTAILTGITEPIEFTFLFLAPSLFLIHALLSATLATSAYALGVVGDFGGGIINFTTLNWLPLWKFHGNTYVAQILIGLLFSVIWYLTFTFMIKKFDLKTPGREETEEVGQLYTKKDYLQKKGEKGSRHSHQAASYLELLGGKDNVVEVTNCATRLRLTVKDPKKVGTVQEFQQTGAHGLVNDGKGAIQVIVGLTVPMVRESFENLLYNEE